MTPPTPPAATLRLILVDDHPIVRAGMRSLFPAGGSVEVVGEAATGEEAITLARHLQPDVVLCDLRLGEGIDGVETTRGLRAIDPAPVVVILTTFDRDAEILQAVEAGAAGYLLKDAPAEEITSAIRRAAAGELVLSPELTARMVHVMRAPRVRLTDREADDLVRDVRAFLAVVENALGSTPPPESPRRARPRVVGGSEHRNGR